MDNSEGRGQCEPFHRYSFPRLFPVGQKVRKGYTCCVPAIGIPEAFAVRQEAVPATSIVTPPILNMYSLSL